MPPSADEEVRLQQSLAPPVVIIPEKMPPFVYPHELDEYITGAEIMALRVEGGGDNNTHTEGGDYPLGCSGVYMERLAQGMACGSPLSAPCFDRSRCRPPPHGPGPSVYVYDSECSLQNSTSLPPSNESLQLSHTWREVAREAGILSETYEDACVFVHVNKRLDRDPCATESPLWNGGVNHLMVDLTDFTR